MFLAKLATTALLLLVLPHPAQAQGCTQCRDNAAATPPATQRAYRNAIGLLVGPASIFFLVALALLRRQR